MRINPNWISGFVQADGSFHVDISKNKSYKFGIRITPKFIISQHSKEDELMKYIKCYFGVGRVYKSLKRNEVQFVVNSFPQLEKVIINHFDRYPLKSGKLNSYQIFKEIIEMMKNKLHLKKEGLSKIIKICNLMNFSSRRNNSVSISNLNMTGNFNYNKINQNFISGLVDGDGSFSISFTSDRKIKTSFSVSQDSSCEQLLFSLVEFFQCGNVYSLKSKAKRFEIFDLKKIIKFIIPHFKKNFLLTEKKNHFLIFSKACFLLKEMREKTYSQKKEKDLIFKSIVDLAYVMNNNGAKRKFSKEDYLRDIFNNTPKVSKELNV
jgi:hypothetical protein